MGRLVTGANGNLLRMSSRIEHHATYSVAPDALFTSVTSKTYLEDRLAVLGGKNAQITAHRAEPNSAEFALHQGLDSSKLPSAARAVFKGDVVVEREERWQATGDGSYTGTLRASISGVPGEITGTSTIRAAGGGGEWIVDGKVKVNIPLIGGKLEDVIAAQVGKLLASEAEFTTGWLAEHP